MEVFGEERWKSFDILLSGLRPTQNVRGGSGDQLIRSKINKIKKSSQPFLNNQFRPSQFTNAHQYIETQSKLILYLSPFTDAVMKI